MSEIRQWLRTVGLEQYANAFEQNDIDRDLLPDLDHEALKDIGVASTGHRLKLLKAVSALQTEKSDAPSSPPSRTAESVPRASPSTDIERRQLTVMFCDLVGSTELARKLDPEDVRSINRAYREACVGEIARYDGYVARYTGDGILAYFGYPRAHEDDADRALRAGLGIVDAVGRIAPSIGGGEPRALAVRVGVATGPVLVGETIGEGGSRESEAVGETPNLAARLQGVAAPNAVVAAPGTHELTRGHFEFHDLGALALKGIAEPVNGWQALSGRALVSRFVAAHGGSLVPLVGREEELELALRRWHSASRGEGQVVLVSGEPGIGKSRLCEAIAEKLVEAAHTPLRYQCSPHHTSSALFPVITHLAHAARIAAPVPEAERFDRLENFLTDAAITAPEDVSLLADLLSVPLSGQYPTIELDAETRKERTFAALLGLLVSLTVRRPVLLVFEDLHWADPSTLELLDRLVDRGMDLPVLMLLTFRPEFEAPWTGQAHVTLAALSRLTRQQSRALVAHVAGTDALAPATEAQVLNRTDGIPLFIEEVTRSMLESDEGRDAAWMPGASLEIPVSIEGSLRGRLDRLGAGKRVAQTGAAIGREFDAGLLHAVSDDPWDEVELGLEELVAARLVYQRGSGSAARYTFKHALVQDAAYASMLREPRKALHLEIAEALEARHAEKVTSEPEILAHHYATAGRSEEAIAYLQKAGERALQRSANVEATQHLTAALALLESGPEHAERYELELGLRIMLGPALTQIRGQASSDVLENASRAEHLCRRLGDTERLTLALCQQFTHYGMRAQLEDAERIADEILSSSRETGQRALVVNAHRYNGILRFLKGAFGASREHFESVLDLYDSADSRVFIQQYAYNPRMTAGVYLACVMHLLGYGERATHLLEEALAYVRELGHVGSEASGLTVVCLFHQLRDEPEIAHKRARELCSLATQRRLSRFFLAWGEAIGFWAEVEQAASPIAIDRFRAAAADYEGSGPNMFIPYLRWIQGAMEARVGRNTDALSLLDDAMAAVERTGERWLEAEIRRRRAELLLNEPSASAQEAEAELKTALGVARRQGAKTLELRVATTLARSWLSRGERSAAVELLGPVYEGFVEGFERSDLRQAKTLLSDLPTPPSR